MDGYSKQYGCLKGLCFTQQEHLHFMTRLSQGVAVQEWERGPGGISGLRKSEARTVLPTNPK
jgi:hypothetical protein